MSQKQVDYKKKMRMHEALGAKQFKKVVMKVEKARWAITKKYWPTYLEEYEKKEKKDCQRALKRTKSEDKKRKIINFYRYQVLQARKEFNTEKNLNYHMSLKRPTEVSDYLSWNKEVHIDGLLVDLAIATVALGLIGSGVGIEIATAGIGLAAIDATINWQCINLQDYNLCRLNIHKKALEQREARMDAKMEESFGEAANVIQKAFDDTKDATKLPTPSEIVSKINNPEQLRQLKELIEKTYNTQSTTVSKTENSKGAK